MSRAMVLPLAALLVSLFAVVAPAAASVAGVDLLGQTTGGTADRAPVADNAWGEGLTAAERADLQALGLGEAALGAFKRAGRPAFDVYRDTPDFENRGGVITSGGICMGMSSVVRDIKGRVRFEAAGERGDLVRELLASYGMPWAQKRTVRGASSLRDLCGKDQGLEGNLAKLMEAAMVRDLKPATLRSFVSSIIDSEDASMTAGWFSERAAARKLTLVLLATGDLTISDQHIVLCYKALEFEKKRLYYVYDCNRVYERSKNTHRETVLLFDAERKSLRLFPDAYAAAYRGKFDEIRCAESLMGRFKDAFVRAITQDLPNLIATGVGALGDLAGDVLGTVFGGISNAVGGLGMQTARALGGVFIPSVKRGTKAEPRRAAAD